MQYNKIILKSLQLAVILTLIRVMKSDCASQATFDSVHTTCTLPRSSKPIYIFSRFLFSDINAKSLHQPLETPWDYLWDSYIPNLETVEVSLPYASGFNRLTVRLGNTGMVQDEQWYRCLSKHVIVQEKRSGSNKKINLVTVAGQTNHSMDWVVKLISKVRQSWLSLLSHKIYKAIFPSWISIDFAIKYVISSLKTNML